MKKRQVVRKITSCRVCNGKKLVKVLSLGSTPLANAFLKKEQLDLPEQYFPLDVYFCNDCSMLQLGHVVSQEILFGNYVYVSSTSPVFVKHFQDFAKDVFQKFKLNNKSFIIDIGSNDGILLKPFKELGAKVLGVEPAVKIAKIAQKDGIKTLPYFFNLALAKKIVKERGKANVVTATNVFAHIDDLDEVIKGLQILLEDDGIFIIEAPYLVDFIQKRYFDLVYHEHLSYWSVTTLIKLFKRFEMKVFNAERVNSHGGSIRVFVSKLNSRHRLENKVKKFVNEEERTKLSDVLTYFKYGKLVLQNKMELSSLLIKLKLNNKAIVGYGAPAKGNTLLNYFKIGQEILDYVIDDSPLKQGLSTPGTHIPVVSSLKLQTDNPDYVLILAWNFAKPIIEKLSAYRKAGGKFIIPVPKPLII